MAFITLEDLLGPVEVIVFPRDYEANQDLSRGAKLFIRGRCPSGTIRWESWCASR